MSTTRKNDVKITARGWGHFILKAAICDLKRDTTLGNEAANLAYSWKTCAAAELILQAQQYVPKFNEVVEWDGHWSNDGAEFFAYVEDGAWYKALAVLHRLEHRAAAYVNAHRGARKCD